MESPDRESTNTQLEKLIDIHGSVSPFSASAQSEAVGQGLDTGGAGGSHQAAYRPGAPRAPCWSLVAPDQTPLGAWQAALAQVHTRTSENVQIQNSETLTGELLSHITVSGNTVFWFVINTLGTQTK